MEFYEKLGAIQADLKAPKGQKNSFGGYRYRSCEDILEALKPLLKREGLVLNITDDIVEVGGRVYVKSKATVTDGSNFMNATAFARESDSKKGMDPSQVTGAASSYARKYALNGLFCIDDTKDADTDAYTKSTRDTKDETISFGTASEAAPIRSGEDLPFDLGESVELRGLRALMDKDGITEAQVLSAFKGKYASIWSIEPATITSELLNKWEGFVKYIKGGKKS